MCSGCINDRNGLVGLCGAGKVPAELSALARLEVTPEGRACSHLAARPRTRGRDMPKGLSYCLHVPLPKHSYCIIPGKSRSWPWAEGVGQGLAWQCDGEMRASSCHLCAPGGGQRPRSGQLWAGVAELFTCSS